MSTPATARLGAPALVIRRRKVDGPLVADDVAVRSVAGPHPTQLTAALLRVGRRLVSNRAAVGVAAFGCSHVTVLVCRQSTRSEEKHRSQNQVSHGACSFTEWLRNRRLRDDSCGESATGAIRRPAARCPGRQPRSRTSRRRWPWEAGQPPSNAPRPTRRSAPPPRARPGAPPPCGFATGHTHHRRWRGSARGTGMAKTARDGDAQGQSKGREQCQGPEFSHEHALLQS